MSGSYDIYNYLESYFDDNVYYNNPMMYLKNLDDDYHLPRLQHADSIVIVTGQGAFEAPDRSREFSDLLNSKGIPHRLDALGNLVQRPVHRLGLPVIGIGSAVENIADAMRIDCELESVGPFGA